MLAGKWTYRSFGNEMNLVGNNADAALALILEEGVFDFEAEGDNRFRGALGMSSGNALELEAKVDAEQGDGRQEFSIHGEGVAATPTMGWRYDFHGYIGHLWPDAQGQVPSLVGTVIRVNAQGPEGPAVQSASFIAVKHTDDAAPPPVRRFGLTAGL